MNKIKSDISNNSFERVYLLCGDEAYLRKLYLSKLKNAMLEAGDEMNYTYFEGKPSWIKELVETCDTLPFFAEKRVIVCEGTNLLKGAEDFVDRIPELPDTTCLIFVEEEADKRTKLYKAVKANGYICEMNALSPRELKLFIISRFRERGKVISDRDAALLLDQLGNDMNMIANEVEKICSYAEEKNVITQADYMPVITPSVQSHIFQMIDYIALGKQSDAVMLYNELLKLRQAPLGILANISKHFESLLRIGELLSEHASDADIIKKAGIRDWKLPEYKRQLRAIGIKRAAKSLEECVNAEYSFKSGSSVSDQLAVEMIIVGLSAGKENNTDF